MSDNHLHVYGQKEPHDHISIYGEENALVKLAELLLLAAKSKNRMVESEIFFDGDGEGYAILAQVVPNGNLSSGAFEMPYGKHWWEQ